MADPNNIPQQAQQLKEELNSPNEETNEQAKTDVANTDFDKEYAIAQKNENGSGTQSSDPNPVNRQSASAGSSSRADNKIDNTNSPGDSNPDDYKDMAKEITQNVKANQ